MQSESAWERQPTRCEAQWQGHALVHSGNRLGRRWMAGLRRSRRGASSCWSRRCSVQAHIPRKRRAAADESRRPPCDRLRGLRHLSELVRVRITRTRTGSALLRRAFSRASRPIRWRTRRRRLSPPARVFCGAAECLMSSSSAARVVSRLAVREQEYSSENLPYRTVKRRVVAKSVHGVWDRASSSPCTNARRRQRCRPPGSASSAAYFAAEQLAIRCADRVAWRGRSFDERRMLSASRRLSETRTR